MTSEQLARISLGWSREKLAREGGVSVASIYLLERGQTAGAGDDALIRDALVYGLTKRWMNTRLLSFDSSLFRVTSADDADHKSGAGH